MRYIGDVHGTVNAKTYQVIAKEVEQSIQIGDLGIGFADQKDAKAMFKDLDLDKHSFIRGNHDNPDYCKAQKNYIPSGYHSVSDTFFVNGGWSIDGPGCPWCPSYKNFARLPYRREGINWWSDEEESQDELDDLIQNFAETKPSIMITHEGPTSVTDYFFNPRQTWESRTAKALQEMLNNHKPNVWIFGHWHKHKDQVLGGKTRFICLSELGFIDL